MGNESRHLIDSIFWRDDILYVTWYSGNGLLTEQYMEGLSADGESRLEKTY